jgi:branched-chain amino acid transport system substrate-binding protein
MRNSKTYFICFVFLLLVVVSACKKDNHDQLRVLDIGLLLPLTGSGASPGASIQAALEIARDDINNYLDQIGADFSVNLNIEDTKTDTLMAMEKISLLHEKGIQLIIGPYSSAELKNIKTFADQHDMLVVSPSSVAISLAIPNDNILRLVPNDLEQAEAMDTWLQTDSIDILVPVVRNDLWGKELCNATSAQFAAHNGIITEPIYYAPADQDFNNELQSLEQNIQQVEAQYPGKKLGIYLVSFGEGTKILTAASQFPVFLNYRWYGSSAFAQNGSLLLDFQASVFALGRGLPCPVFGLDMNAIDKWQPLTDKLTARLGRKPEVYALVAYDALWLSVLSYLNTGIDVNTATLKKAFFQLSADYYGVTGRTTLNEAGDRAVANYDFWGVRMFLNDFSWFKIGTYNNMTGKLEKY